MTIDVVCDGTEAPDIQKPSGFQKDQTFEINGSDPFFEFDDFKFKSSTGDGCAMTY